jgi:hypothetical protein
MIEVSAEDAPARPDERFLLGPGYPNPCSSSSHGAAIIPFELRDDAAVRIDLCDALGRVVLTAAERVYAAGRHLLPLEPERLAAGFYTVRMRVGDAVASRPLIVTR